MPVANTSQLLIKNLSLLSAKHPLFINLPADDFIDEYKATYSAAELSFLNFHYGEFLAHKNKQHNVQFTHQYNSDVYHDIVVIHFPKSKAELAFTLSMIGNSLNSDTIIYFVGEKNSGVKSVEKLAKNHLNHCQKDDAARHCMLFSGCYMPQDEPFNIDNWFKHYSIEVQETSLDIYALPGVFSHEKLDIGTQVLLRQLPEYNDSSLLDFGCGAGIIAAYIAKTNSNVRLSLADVNALALVSAKKTLAQNSIDADFIATDSMSNIKSNFDHVISNPPFHQGLKTHYHATETFLGNIVKHINTNGTLTIVANSFLKYQPIIEPKFKQVKQLTKSNGFTVYWAKR